MTCFFDLHHGPGVTTVTRSPQRGLPGPCRPRRRRGLIGGALLDVTFDDNEPEVINNFFEE
ncbi:hypothetical protein ACIBJF_43640 [Streptomyces sp. NPDC050743]|uniref:hypothetical protein n=1 Tax=Streptomyces sp. NPDC050743 TaxID=3365634 RepID=UPI0037B5CCB1